MQRLPAARPRQVRGELAARHCSRSPHWLSRRSPKSWQSKLNQQAASRASSTERRIVCLPSLHSPTWVSLRRSVDLTTRADRQLERPQHANRPPSSIRDSTPRRSSSNSSSSRCRESFKTAQASHENKRRMPRTSFSGQRTTRETTSSTSATASLSSSTRRARSRRTRRKS